jgi:esterase/lipase superfamily enzyme
LAALDAIRISRGERVLGRVVFAAPDEDRQVFIGRITEGARAARSRHLYASSQDTALKLSAKFRLGQSIRAGLGGHSNIIVIPTLESMDASKLQSDGFGHNYVFVSRKGLGDIRQLIVEGKKAVERGLVGTPKDGGEYYPLFEQ